MAGPPFGADGAAAPASRDGRSPSPAPDGALGNGHEPEPWFHLFVYGTLRSDRSRSPVLEGCRLVRSATVDGTLYQLGDFPAFMRFGGTPVRGEIWRCPADLLWKLDEYENVEGGLFRRIGIEVDGLPCWMYVAGPALAHRLTPDRRMSTGDWTPASS